MLLELIKRCEIGDNIACWQLYLQYHLMQQFENVCKNLHVETPLVIIEKPLHKESAYNWGKMVGEREIFNVLAPPMVEDLNISNEVKHKVLTDLHKEMSKLIENLNQNIIDLEQQKTRKETA